jgi:hypothetical protein
MSIYVKEGTPLHGASKCHTCMHSHVVKGYRESEELVVCQSMYPERRIPFLVRECSSYAEVKRQTLKQMEEMAWILSERGKRMTGFGSSVKRDATSENEVELVLFRKPSEDDAS